MPETPSIKLRQPLPPPGGVSPCELPYAELSVTSNFSFLRGASHPDELVYTAARLGYRAMAITDCCTLAGAVRAHVAAKACGMKLVIGCRLQFIDGTPDLLVWCMNRTGYANLCRLLTLGKRRAEKGQCQLRLDDLLERNAGLLAGIASGDGPPPAPREINRLRESFGDRLWLAVALHYSQDHPSHLDRMRAWSRDARLPLLAVNDVHYHDPGRRVLQDVLVCIRHQTTIDQAGRRLFQNAERYLKSPEQMQRLFRRCPPAMAATMAVADRCSFSLDELKYEYPDELVPDGKTPAEYLAELTWAGARERYGGDAGGLWGVPARVCRQIEHELQLIRRLNFEPYFLTVHDLVKFARSRGILCQGRGSAANSAVCYCLGITAVDPARIDLLFERFISADRGEPPDIDIDFEHERREEVIQYLYQKYGRDRAALAAEVITYRGRSAIRDVGKAMGLSLDMVDSMARKLDWWHRGVLTDPMIREAGLDPGEPNVRRVLNIATELLGFPRHLSQHVGGMVISRGPLSEVVPIENARMPDRTVVEWDKDDLDELGLLKIDVLGLGMLTCISKALAMVNAQVQDQARAQGSALPGDCGAPAEACVLQNPRPATPLQLHAIPPEDPAVYDMICDADTIGVFQIESRAQMSMLPRLRPRNFYDLVIEVAIVRPGPIQGNMVHPYLRRRNGEEEVFYPSAALEEVLKKTLGVPLFQEQAMRLAMVGAGFTAAEADQLRRAMAAWKKSTRLLHFRDRIISGMLQNGYTRPFAEQCFDQIKGFGEYGFPESHAASFALLVYVSAWLKRHHPAAFAAALINSQPMGFYMPAQIIRDARCHGVTVCPIDVNHSHWDCTLERPQTRNPPVASEDKTTWGLGGPVLRLGMRLIKGLRQFDADVITARRNAAGPFQSIESFHRRTGVRKAVMRRLAEADAFASMGLTRRQALWHVMKLSDDAAPLYETDQPDETASRLPAIAPGQQVLTDYQTTGLSLREHPVALIRAFLNRQHVLTAEQMMKVPHGRFVRVAGLVLVRQRPGTASGIVFITLEDETGIANLIVRPGVYDRFRPAARHAALLQCDGLIQREGKVIHVLARRLIDRSDLLAGLQFSSRDFN